MVLTSIRSQGEQLSIVCSFKLRLLLIQPNPIKTKLCAMFTSVLTSIVCCFKLGFFFSSGFVQCSQFRPQLNLNGRDDHWKALRLCSALRHIEKREREGRTNWCNAIALQYNCSAIRNNEKRERRGEQNWCKYSAIEI